MLVVGIIGKENKKTRILVICSSNQNLNVFFAYKFIALYGNPENSEISKIDKNFV